MAIVINIDVMLAKRKMSVTELSERVGITLANISVLKNGKAKAIRLSTLEGICRALQCQPGDVLEYRDDAPLDSPQVLASAAVAATRQSPSPAQLAPVQSAPARPGR